MLYFIHSNHLERLLDCLCRVLADSDDDPLLAREIVVQNPGMARWVCQQVALRTGIAANLRFPLPARFIWQVFAGQLDGLEDDSSFARPVLRWRILDALPGMVGRREFSGVAGYLQDDRDGRKAFQLAGRVADLFDQYLVYRPGMLLEWEADTGPEWQSVLWNRLVKPSGNHRALYYRQFLEKARRGGLDPSAFPRRICLFGISSLAPAYLEILHAVSRVVDVHLFHLSPCREYWGDLSSDAEAARKRSVLAREGGTPGSDFWDRGNPLLASLGKMGRDFVSQVYGLEMIEQEEYEDPSGRSLLACVQRDILDLVDRSDPAAEKVTVAGGDRSVQLHSCHSRMREIQVLHDRLLEMFENDPDLRPGDILVMGPNIEEYASAIATVFDGAAEDTFIPWSLADRSIRGEEPLAASFLSLFDLCEGRCSGPEVVSFLETGAVRRRFGIEEEELAMIREWVVESGIRWGLDREHRNDFGGPMADAHTWSFGMDRLLMGYFIGEEEGLAHGIAPLSGQSSGRGGLLGRLAAFLDLLRTTRVQLVPARSPGQWAALLLGLLDAFYDAGNGEEDQQALYSLRETICAIEDDCRLAGFAGNLSLTVIRSWLNESLSGPSSGQAFLSGRVTFCNMVPLRSVPFGVVCLVGMNDGEYPRSQPGASFDLMVRDPRLGDRSRRDDDRYLFLEALLSARKVLYVSWLGRDQRDNSIRPPSVVVAELLDYITRSFVGREGLPLDRPVTEHPLQPFSRRCFDGTHGTGSYAGQWVPPGEGEGDETVFAGRRLPDPPEEWRSVDLGRLVRFWSHPVRFFLRQRLDMRLGDDDELLGEAEPFHPDFLERYLLTSRLADAFLRDRPADEQWKRFEAEGLLPHGGFGENLFRELREKAEMFVPGVIPLIRNPRDDMEIDLVIGRFRLQGWLSGLYEGGLVRYRPAGLKGRDLVKAWIEHLVYNGVAGSGCDRRSTLIGSDRSVMFRSVEEPLPLLADLLELYWHGLTAPLHFYPETSLAWFDEGKGGNEVEARKSWYTGFNRAGEGDGFEYRIALQGRDPLDREFEDLASDVYGPLFSRMEVRDADV